LDNLADKIKDVLYPFVNNKSITKKQYSDTVATVKSVTNRMKALEYGPSKVLDNLSLTLADKGVPPIIIQELYKKVF